MSGQNAGLSAKQQAAVARALPKQRVKLRRSYRAQSGSRADGEYNRRTAGEMPRLLRQPAPAIRRPAQTRFNVPQVKHLAKLWNPLNPTPIPTAVSDGHAHVTTGMDRFSLTVETGMKAMVIVSNVGSAGLCGAVFHWSSSQNVKVSSLVLPTLSGCALDNTGPTSGRAMKCS
jgi:hypothetical protein